MLNWFFQEEYEYSATPQNDGKKDKDKKKKKKGPDLEELKQEMEMVSTSCYLQMSQEIVATW